MAISQVTPDELAAKILDGAVVIDVREPDEYQAGHVPGALSIPLSTVPDEIDQFRLDEAPYVVCKSGGRSLQACEILAREGVEAINVSGGTDGWIAAGQPVVEGDEPS